MESAVQELCEEINVFSSLVVELKDVDGKLQTFNNGFGKLVAAVSALQQESAVEVTVDDPKHNKEENVDVERKLEKKGTTSAKRTRNDEKTKPRKKQKADLWQRTKQNYLKELPRKYQNPEHAQMLHVVWKTVTKKSEGVTLADVVKACERSVLQVNEYLAILVKFKVLTRKKERTGLRYCNVAEIKFEKS